MLFSPVYIESHPRRDAGLAACCTSSIFSNPFRSYSFRTLASLFRRSVSSNPFAFKCFRTLCKIPGIGYPPLATRHSPLATFYPSPLLSVVSGLFLRNGAPQPQCFQTLPASFHCNGGVYPFTQLAPSFEGSVLREGLHLHREPISFSSIQKSAECRRVSTRPERLMAFISHKSPITSHGPCALYPSTRPQHPTVSGRPQLGYPMPLPIDSIAGRASTWEG
jgi:hypothetical protein